MKVIKCEMCGSSDLVKQDGVFVCQSCGLKYSTEEIKKLMIEGTVDVSGSTVKVDTTDELENLYQIARRAKNDNNRANAAKYYDMIMVKDPTSWEAAFFSVYFTAMDCMVPQLQSAAISVSNCEESVLGLIRDFVPKEEQAAAVEEVMKYSILAATNLTAGAKSHYDGISSGSHYDGISSSIRKEYTREYVNNVWAAKDIVYTCGNQIDKMFGDNEEIGKYAVDAWKAGIAIHETIIPHLADKAGSKSTIDSYYKKISKYDRNCAEKFFENKKQHFENEKQHLESEINRIKLEISQKTVKNPGSLRGFLGFYFGAAGLVIMAISSIMFDEWGFGIFFLGMAGVCVYGAIKSAKTIKENKILEQLKTELAGKEAELKKLLEENK